MKKRFLIGAFVLATVFATVFGLAATLSVSPNGLGAGSSSVGSCDSDGVSTSYANSWDATDKRYEVTSVTVNGIANTCDGKSLKAALTDSSNVLLGDGSVTVPTDGAATTATVSSLSANPAASSVNNVHVVIGD
jgi:hypothetical protein